MNCQRANSAQRSFTLIELLVVISIIATLSAVLALTVPAIRRSTLIRAAKGDLRKACTAIDTYYADHRHYPRSGIATVVEVPTFTDTRLTVTIQARSIDRQNSVFHHEVKAVTYHELDIKAVPGGYEATVIVDI